MTLIKYISVLLLFVFSDLNGQKLDSINLFDYQNKTQVNASQIMNGQRSMIVFFDPHCPYVNFYSKRIKEISILAETEGFAVIFVNPHQMIDPQNNSAKINIDFIKEEGWKGGLFGDPKQELAKLLGASKLPGVFLIQFKNGKKQILYKGAIDDNPQNADQVSESYVKTFLQNNGSSGLKSIPAMGCHIKKF